MPYIQPTKNRSHLIRMNKNLSIFIYIYCGFTQKYEQVSHINFHQEESFGAYVNVYIDIIENKWN